MHDEDGLASQLGEAITITIQFGAPGPRQQLGVALGASDDGGGVFTKAEVVYGKPSEDDEDRRCGNCAHYSDRRCDIVSGSIDPEKVCDKWDD